MSVHLLHYRELLAYGNVLYYICIRSVSVVCPQAFAFAYIIRIKVGDRYIRRSLISCYGKRDVLKFCKLCSADRLRYCQICKLYVILGMIVVVNEVSLTCLVALIKYNRNSISLLTVNFDHCKLMSLLRSKSVTLISSIISILSVKSCSRLGDSVFDTGLNVRSIKNDRLSGSYIDKCIILCIIIHISLRLKDTILISKIVCYRDFLTVTGIDLCSLIGNLNRYASVRISSVLGTVNCLIDSDTVLIHILICIDDLCLCNAGISRKCDVLGSNILRIQEVE